MRIVVLAFLVSLWIPGVVEAQEVRMEEARQAFEAGTVAFNESRWQDCATEFERSFSLLFAPELLYNIGLCYQRVAGALPDSVAGPVLGRALAAYRRYVRELPEAEDVAQVVEAIGSLQERIARIERESEWMNPDPEPPPVVSVSPVPPESIPESDPEVLVRPRGEYPVTIAAGALTLALTAVAVGLGVRAQDLYDGLSGTCGRAPEGCPEAQIAEVGSLSLGANVLYGLAGAALLGTGLGFGFEFTAMTDTGSRAFLSVRGSF